MEIITGVERRRQWRDEEKLRILAELDAPGAKFSAVARRHDISRGERGDQYGTYSVHRRTDGPVASG